MVKYFPFGEKLREREELGTASVPSSLCVLSQRLSTRDQSIAYKRERERESQLVVARSRTVSVVYFMNSEFPSSSLQDESLQADAMYRATHTISHRRAILLYSRRSRLRKIAFPPQCPGPFFEIYMPRLRWLRVSAARETLATLL